MPEITVYMNCDTRLAINLQMFNLGENDEFIFAIKNFDYIDSPCVFLFRARKDDMDDNGEVIFKIPPMNSKSLKPGAFYNFAVLFDAFDPKRETEYRKLTDNGNIRLEYGAHDLMIEPESHGCKNEIIGMHLELLDEISSVEPTGGKCEVIDIRLELLDEISSVSPDKYKCEVLGVRLELLDALSSIDPEKFRNEVVGIRLELLDALSSIDPEKFRTKVEGVRLELQDEISSVVLNEIINMRLEPLIAKIREGVTFD
jgi:hypothetical protein